MSSHLDDEHPWRNGAAVMATERQIESNRRNAMRSTGPISAEGKAKPEKAPQLLHELSSYVQFRYVGELELALEYLGGLAIFAHRLLSEASNFGLSFVGSLRK